MQKLYYQFPGTWFGDCMPFGHGDKFYLYHQRDTRKPGPFGEPFGWDLATTSDFVQIKAWQFREEQMKNRISSSLQAVFSRQKDSIIFFIQVITVIIRHLENHLRF